MFYSFRSAIFSEVLFSVSSNEISNKMSCLQTLLFLREKMYFSQHIVLKGSQNFAHSPVTYKKSIWPTNVMCRPLAHGNLYTFAQCSSS